MDQRPSLHQILKGLFAKNPHVYHQPPENVRLEYPCIIYKMTGIQTNHADNLAYIQRREYQLTVIDRNPDSPLREAVIDSLGKKFSGRFVRPFVSDGLNHYIFTIYY